MKLEASLARKMMVPSSSSRRAVAATPMVGCGDEIAARHIRFVFRQRARRAARRTRRPCPSRLGRCRLDARLVTPGACQPAVEGSPAPGPPRAHVGWRRAGPVSGGGRPNPPLEGRTHAAEVAERVESVAGGCAISTDMCVATTDGGTPQIVQAQIQGTADRTGARRGWAEYAPWPRRSCARVKGGGPRCRMRSGGHR